MSNSLFLNNTLLLQPLSTIDEVELLNSVSQNTQVRDELIVRNLHLAVEQAIKFSNEYFSIEDLSSIGTIGLIKAIDTFSFKNESNFSLYAKKCIENEILMYLTHYKNCSKMCSLDDTDEMSFVDESLFCTTNFTDVYSNRDLIVIIMNYVFNVLPINNSLAFIYNICKKTQKEIGNKLGVTQSYISKILREAHKRIKAFVNRAEKSNEKIFINKIYFSIPNEYYFSFSFCKEKFKNFNEIINLVLSEEEFEKLQIPYDFSEDEESYILKVPYDVDSFLLIAELLRNSVACN